MFIIACERTDIVPWHLRLGISFFLVAGICIGVGLFLSVFGAKFFKLVVVILVIAGGGAIVRSIIGKYLHMSNLGN